MQNKKLSVILIIVAFVLGYFFFRFTSPKIGPKTSSTGTDGVNSAVQQTDTTKPVVSNNKVLNLSGQGLEKLPAYVLLRIDLEELNISNNRLTGALPSEIGKLRNLKVLNASNNLMTGVPAEIGHLPNLEVLDLSNNQLTGLPNELANLKKLKTLNLSGNNYSAQDLDVIKKGLSPDVNIIL